MPRHRMSFCMRPPYIRSFAKRELYPGHCYTIRGMLSCGPGGQAEPSHATGRHSDFDHVTHIIDGFAEVRLNRQRSDDLYADTEETSQAVKESKIQTARVYNGKYILSQTFFYTHLAAIVFILPQTIPVSS